jgi:RNA polymerase sigma-70 factor (ECF subfamily)
MLDDNLLWQGFQQGNQEMFLSIYRKYYHSLFFIGLKEVGDADLVKDAIQQQFLYLWEKRTSIAAANNVRTYLVASFLRKLRADWKKSGRDTSLEVAWNKDWESPDLTVEEILILKSDHHQLTETLAIYINTLPPRQKELIEMRFYLGLSYEEIAEKTGLTYRTIYNKIHEALKRIRSGLDNRNDAIGAAL